MLGKIIFLHFQIASWQKPLFNNSECQNVNVSQYIHSLVFVDMSLKVYFYSGMNSFHVSCCFMGRQSLTTMNLFHVICRYMRWPRPWARPCEKKQICLMMYTTLLVQLTNYNVYICSGDLVTTFDIWILLMCSCYCVTVWEMRRGVPCK